MVSGAFARLFKKQSETCQHTELTGLMKHFSSSPPPAAFFFKNTLLMAKLSEWSSCTVSFCLTKALNQTYKKQPVHIQPVGCHLDYPHLSLAASCFEWACLWSRKTLQHLGLHLGHDASQQVLVSWAAKHVMLSPSWWGTAFPPTHQGSGPLRAF